MATDSLDRLERILTRIVEQDRRDRRYRRKERERDKETLSKFRELKRRNDEYFGRLSQAERDSPRSNTDQQSDTPRENS